MQRLVRRLLAEHKRLMHLMDVVAREADVVSEGGEMDAYLVREVLGYCASYANVFHHPAEDRALERLMRKRPDLRDLVYTLRVQHGDLVRRTYDLMNMVDGVAMGSFATRADLARAMHEFADLHRRHRDFEEQDLFPLFLEALDARDFSAIEAGEVEARGSGRRNLERRHLRRVYRWLAAEG